MSEDIFIVKNYLKGMEFSIKHQIYFEINYEQTKEFYNSIHKLLKEIEEKNIAINKMSKDISRQLEEIDEKSTIIMAGAEKVKQLEKEIQRLEKDNDTLSELVIVNEDKVIKELDLISKDKIREILETERIKALDRFDNKLDVKQRIYKRNIQVALIDKLKKVLLEENDE